MAKARPHFSVKRIAIDKANARMLSAVAAAAFFAVFSLVASQALVSQMKYQNKVIKLKKTALNQLKVNITETDKLYTAYQEFAGNTENVLGGNPKADGPKDGENPRIVLDALPSKYDFPALATSIEKVLKENSYTITSIDGIDDEVAQSKKKDTGAAPKPIDIPFSFTAPAESQRAKELSQLLERSIRPIEVLRMTVTIREQGGRLIVKMDGKTYFQPEKSLKIEDQVIAPNGSAKKPVKKSTGATKK